MVLLQRRAQLLRLRRRHARALRGVRALAHAARWAARRALRLAHAPALPSLAHVVGAAAEMKQVRRGVSVVVVAAAAA